MILDVSRLNNLLQLRANFYLTDLLDIAIIALFIYTLFIFFKKTRTYMIFLGIAIASGLYILSTTLNLYLTFVTLRYFVGVSLILFAIVFQSEIRKYFEFLGLIGSRQMKVGPLAPKSPATAEVIQACVRMAQSKVGALIVVQGKDNLDSFIEGGTPLDGIISEDVILSIFDPHSDGHDGALIIRNDRISRFGAHLPLSTNFKEIGKHGTRHSAGLGLSEHADAMCIIASEEKGRLSVCRDGKLKTLTQFSDLEKELDRFIKNKFTSQSKGRKSNFFQHDLVLKTGSLMLAGVLWFFTAYQAGITEKSFLVPITLNNMPKDIVIEEYNPKSIRVTVNGRGDAILSKVSESDFKVNFDASVLDSGVNKQKINNKDIVLPSNISLVSYEPGSFLLTTKKYYTVQVPVSVRTSGELTEGLEMKSIAVSPDYVEVFVLEETEAPEKVYTEVIDISSFKEPVIIPVPLVIPEGSKIVNGQEEVSVAITIEKIQPKK
jgi:diadenylate cyclase